MRQDSPRAPSNRRTAAALPLGLGRRPPRARAATVVLGVLVAVLAATVAWRMAETDEVRARDQAEASRTALALGERLDRVEATVRQLTYTAGDPGLGPAAREHALRAALAQDAPGWIRALALVAAPADPRRPPASAARSRTDGARLEEVDVRALASHAAALREARLERLEEGAMLLLVPAELPGAHDVVGVALLDPPTLLAVGGSVAYQVHGPRGRVVYAQGVSPLLGRTADAQVRTLRRGDAPWTVAVLPSPPEGAWVRVLATGLVTWLVVAAAFALSAAARRRRELEAAARLYGTLFEVAADLVVLVDDELRVARANGSAAHLLRLEADGADPPEAPPPFLDAVVDHQRELAGDALRRALEGQASEFTAHLVGQPRSLYRFRCAPLVVDHAVVGLQLLAEDVTEKVHLDMELAERRAELERLNQELYRAAITDPLTGVYNRRHLTARTRDEVERSLRYGHGLACLFLDLDHFKRINDTHGHAVGDQVLRTFAAILRRNLRRSDLIGRYGGEEFVVLLTNTTEDQIDHIAEKLLSLTRETRFPGLPVDVRVTVSIGAACLRADGPRTTDALLEAADAALYRAKAEGRDRLVIDRALAA